MKASSQQLLLYIQEDLHRFLKRTDAPEQTRAEFAASKLVSNLLKKYLGDQVELDAADNKALKLFLSVNEGLLGAPREAVTMMDQYLLGELKSSLDRFWFVNGDRPLVGSLHDLFQNGRVGPGASLGVREPCFYTKLFQSNLTTTSPLLYNSYSASLDKCSYLHSDAENHRMECWGAAKVVEYSKLSFVPKRWDISRTICTEPNLNMFYQLGLARILESRLAQTFKIRLDSQPDFNRELARLGSIDGRFSTIDLSSASDSLSTGVLRDILPKGLYSWLMSLRTPATMLPDGRVVQLKMVSTMGNGFTFPLETLIFCSAVAAAYRIAGIERVDNSDRLPGNWGVFGDDIIVVKEVYPLITRLLYLLGFTVNTDKTFFEGPFRESCGGDFFLGHLVRGVYIKSLRSQQDRYIAINLLNSWSYLQGIPLPHAIGYLLSTVRRVLIPPHCGLDQGIHVPFSMVERPQVNMNGSFKYRAFAPVVRRVRVGDNCSSLDGKFKPNLSGLELAAIQGSVRSYRVGLRQQTVTYKVKGYVTPDWGSTSPQSLDRLKRPVSWETMTHLNFLL